MNKTRLIARIDVKNDHVIKGIHLEGLRKVGDPNEFAKKYYDHGIDEIIFMDAVAAYYDRNSLSHIIEKACQNVFIPITVGGGIRTLDDIQTALNSGADKVAINTQATKDPSFITQAAQRFGSQCIAGSIVAKKSTSQSWEAYIDNGREPTGKDVIEWAKELESLGAGELMVTSLDYEGTKKGFELPLYSAIQDQVTIPLIACGGMGQSKHILKLLEQSKVEAIATASVLHYDIDSIANLKEAINSTGYKVRL